MKDGVRLDYFFRCMIYLVFISTLWPSHAFRPIIKKSKRKKCGVKNLKSMPQKVTFKQIVVLSSLHHRILLHHVSKEKSPRSPRFVPWYWSQHKTRTLQIEKVSYESNGGRIIHLSFCQE